MARVAYSVHPKTMREAFSPSASRLQSKPCASSSTPCSTLSVCTDRPMRGEPRKGMANPSIDAAGRRGGAALDGARAFRCSSVVSASPHSHASCLRKEHHMLRRLAVICGLGAGLVAAPVLANEKEEAGEQHQAITMEQLPDA